ncbi:MAG: glycosyl hydrolase family 28 protein [Terriglobia bacterium]
MRWPSEKPVGWATLAVLVLIVPILVRAEETVPSFNVRNYGATGKKSDDARKAIQSAIDACAKAGGGRVYLPPGDYTSGTLHLRSHVRLYIEAGATLFASEDPAVFDKPALIYGEDLENLTIEGRGTIDGQAQYIWEEVQKEEFNSPYGVLPASPLFNVVQEIERRALPPGVEIDWKKAPYFGHITYNLALAEERAKAQGEPLMRSYPKGWPTHPEYPHMIQIIRCKDVRIAGLSILHSPSWTINPINCERLNIEGLYIFTSLKYGVWADGIDPDGCQDVRIANCTIETGDDSIVFYSMNWHGPALPCENITVTNCRLTSASAAIKFCDAFMVSDGGYVDNVVLSNLVIGTRRYDWFWWGDGDPLHFMIERRSESQGRPDQPGEPHAGSIRNVMIRNVIAHGQGSCLITGHPSSWLENVSLENLRLFISTNPSSPYDKAVNALQFRYARNLNVQDVEVTWQKPEWVNWQSALYFEDVEGLKLQGFTGGPARLQTPIPAVVLDQVDEAVILNSQPRPGTQLFLKVKGAKSRNIYLVGNELHGVKTPYQLDSDVKPGSVKAANNF